MQEINKDILSALFAQLFEAEQLAKDSNKVCDETWAALRSAREMRDGMEGAYNQAIDSGLSDSGNPDVSKILDLMGKVLHWKNEVTCREEMHQAALKHSDTDDAAVRELRNQIKSLTQI